jgi:cell division septum initiation protein DivIVA
LDVHDQLGQLETKFRDAKAMPMSASCLVNRAETLQAVKRLRDALPADLDQADALLSERDAVLAAGREQVERLLEGARAEREQLIEQTDLLVAARARAASLTTEARAEAARLLADADDYVDRKLAEFEVVIGQLGSQVSNGRERLAARRTADLARVRATAQASPTDGAAREAEAVIAAEVPQLWPT